MKSNLKKTNTKFKIVDKESNQKFVLEKKNIKINIYDEELIEEIIDKDFNKKYRELLYIIMEIKENDDSTDSDESLCLIKIEELKNIILSKYFKYIGKDLLNKYLRMILLLEEKLRTPKKQRGR